MVAMMMVRRGACFWPGLQGMMTLVHWVEIVIAKEV